MSTFQIREPDGNVVFDGTERQSARFRVQPPTDWAFSDESQTEQRLVRLNGEEGSIDVTITRDGRGIEIRGNHRLSVEPNASNSVTIYLADERVDPGQTSR